MTWSSAIILDAGSSGTRLYMYEWKKCDGATNPWQLHIRKLESWQPSEGVGISELVKGKENIDIDGLQKEVNDYLHPFVTRALGRVPNGVRPETIPLFLLATAGVRKLKLTERNALTQCMKLCPELSSFNKKDCGTITGEQEALFGWLAAAYLRDPSGLGYVEMGGASAQIAFPLSADDAANYGEQKEVENTNKAEIVRQSLPEYFNHPEWLGEHPQPPFIWEYHEQYAKRRGEGEPALPPDIRKYYEQSAMAGGWGMPPLLPRIRDHYLQLGPDVKVVGAEASLLRLHSPKYYQAYGTDTKVVNVRIGPWNSAMLLVSYPLGLNEAREIYDEYLTTNGERRNEFILDPSKPDWYTGDRRFRGIASDDKARKRQMSQKVMDIFTSFGPLSIGDALVEIGRKLNFVAGAGFWHSMKGSVVDDLPFIFQDYYRSVLQIRTQPSTAATRAQMAYDPLFKVFWIMWVLRHSFGINTTKNMEDVEAANKKVREAKTEAKAAKAMAEAMKAEAEAAERASATGGDTAVAEAGRMAEEAEQAKEYADTAAAKATASQEERPVEFMPYNGAGGIALSWTLGQLIYFAGSGECNPRLVD